MRSKAALQRQTWSIRLVVRQASELMLARAERWIARGPQKLTASVVFGVVLSASIAHLPYRNAESGRWIGIEDAAALGRPVTATAIAHSMGLPATTVRRLAVELVEAGLLVRDAAGFRPAQAVFAEGALARLLADNVDDLARILSALADCDYEPAAKALAAGATALPPGVIERVLLTFALRVIETCTALYGDITDGTIVQAIVAANIRHVTEDPVLAQRYAAEDMPPPDSLRRPIALRALARATDLPFETVRRRVNALIEEGIVVAKEDGVIVPTHVLLDDRHFDNNRRIVTHFEQMTETLVSLAGESRR